MAIQQTHIAVDHKHGRPLISCRFAPGGESVFYGSEDYSVWRWQPGAEKATEYPTDAWVRAIDFTPDGQTLFTGGYDGRLIWWPTQSETPQPLHALEAHEGWLRAVAVSPDGLQVASVGNDRVVRLWDIASHSLAAELVGDESAGEDAPVHRSYVYNVAYHPDGSSLVTGDLMGQLIHWDLASGKPVRSWTAESLSKYDKGFRAQIGGFRCLRFNQDGSKLFASGITKVTNAFAGVGNPSVVEFDWKEGKQVIEYITKPALQGVAWGLGLHPEGTIIGAHGGSNGHLMFWNPGTAETVHQFRLPQNGRDLDLHPDGLQVAVACSDGHLRLCRMEKKEG